VRAACVCCFALALLAPSLLSAETIPAGTVLEVRLQQPISSYSTHKGTKITGVLISPVNESGRILLPLGTTIEGTVVDIRKVGVGVVHETAQIHLVFNQLVLSDGQTFPLQSRLTSVENARESVDKEGRIQGIRSTSTLSHRTSGVVGTLAFGDPIAAIFTTAASTSVLRFSEPEISLPAGTEMLTQVTATVVLPQENIETIPPIVSTPAGKQDLGKLVRSLPFRTYTKGANVPSDLTNLIFIGNADALQRAFQASGWEPVDTLTAQSTYSTVRSVAENQGYRRAPMSTLLLADDAPEFAYAKTLNTFSKRHHLRIWQMSPTWQGQTVWTSSSTHDIGIGFSKKNKTFIHLIDTHIDNERAKVVNDMIFTGCVTGVQLVSRPWVPQDAKNGTDEALITDGKIAVLQLNDCLDPVEEPTAEDGTPLRIHGNELDRTTRQTVLTLRNNILRDNVGVMTYSGIHYLVASKKKEGPAPERTMDIEGSKYTIDQHFDPEDSYAPPSQANSKSASPAANAHALRWTPPSVELGIRSGWLGYNGGNGGAIAYFFQDKADPANALVLVLGNSLDNGWSIGGTVTLDSQKYFSHEFSYDHSFTTFNIGLAVLYTDASSPSVQTAFGFDSSGLGTSQFAYNLLINARPKTSRLRPFFAIGPSLQLMHLDDAPIKKAPAWFKLGLSNIGLISAAYNFGSTPPLEGGGIFQFGLDYGGGIRYRVTPRWMIRADFRETLTSQPDFWTKSKQDILNGLVFDSPTSITVIGPILDSALRQDRITSGVSFTF
jgi:hypothetical protein